MNTLLFMIKGGGLTEVSIFVVVAMYVALFFYTLYKTISNGVLSNLLKFGLAIAIIWLPVLGVALSWLYMGLQKKVI